MTRCVLTAYLPSTHSELAPVTADFFSGVKAKIRHYGIRTTMAQVKESRVFVLRYLTYQTLPAGLTPLVPLDQEGFPIWLTLMKDGLKRPKDGEQ